MAGRLAVCMASRRVEVLCMVGWLVVWLGDEGKVLSMAGWLVGMV